MKNITPFLWFNDNAEEAANFYTSIFKNSRIGNVNRYGEAGSQVSGRKKGTIMTISLQLEGQEFVALNGGPTFTFTPAISFVVNCNTQQEIDHLWNKLSEGGTVLMELGEYPFSEKYGWLNDKFGVSWQLILASRPQKIIPSLMFVGEHHGKAENAMNFYTSLFKNSSIDNIVRYSAGEGEPEGTVKHAVFSLNGQEFMTMDSKREHQFTFTHAISLLVNCENQDEVDDLWKKFTEGGQPEQCGWVKDRFGVSWQIVPTILRELLQDKDTEKSERVMQAMLQMDKIDIKKIKQAYESQ